MDKVKETLRKIWEKTLVLSKKVAQVSKVQSIKYFKAFKVWFKRTVSSNDFAKLMACVLSALGGILIGYMIMLMINAGDTFKLTAYAFEFKFNPNEYIWAPLVGAAPIIITGLSVGFAFKTGLFNIGSSGQVIVGGITAIYVAHAISLPAPLHFLVAMIAAIIAGAIWGGIVGFLKARFNINEVVGSIMMNYIGGYLAAYLVKGQLVYNSLKSQTKQIPVSATIPTWGLDRLLPGSAFDTSIFIAVLAAILMYIVLNKTTLGYQLKAVGFNKNASMNAGIKYKRNIIVSMLISGALSGLAGAMIYLSDTNDTSIKAIMMIPKEGFDGISVALLALNNPIGTIFSAYFINFITIFSTNYIQTFSAFKKEISEIVISVIIYFSALSAMVLMFLNNRKQKRRALHQAHQEEIIKEESNHANSNPIE